MLHLVSLSHPQAVMVTRVPSSLCSTHCWWRNSWTTCVEYNITHPGDSILTLAFCPLGYGMGGKIKVKFTLQQAMKAQRESRVITVHFL